MAVTTMTTRQLDHKSFVSPTSTLLQDNLLMSSPTSPPISSTSSCCEPNTAIVQLMTTLTISDYSRFYDGPIGEFLPTYSQLADGSLVAPPFLQDLKVAFASLLLMGAYLLLSFRNIIVSFRFIRRMKVKNKDLFYMLFASQIFSLVIWIPLVVAMFDNALDCTTILRVTRLFSSVSTDIMITGIFGVKAYRCLDNARFVPVLMALLQIANSTLTVNDLVQLHGIRGLSGLCSRLHPSNMLPVVVILIFVESFFICCCFIYAVWKSSRLLAAQGRLSYRLSLDAERVPSADREKPNCFPSQTRLEPQELSAPRSRGWWDYIPQPVNTISENLGPEPNPSSTYFSKIYTQLSSFYRKHGRGKFPSRKPSIHTEQPSPQHPNLGSLTQTASLSAHSQSGGGRGRIISPISFNSPRLIGLKPRALLFREVMRDELCYTTFVTAVWVITAIIGVVGESRQMFWTATGWLGVNWAIVSLLVVHSFSRVVQRHEQEAMFQNPTFWDNKLRAEREGAKTSRPNGSDRRRAWLSGGLTSSRRPVRSPEAETVALDLADHHRSYQSFDSTQSFLHRTDDRSWSRTRLSWDAPRLSMLNRDSTPSMISLPSTLNSETGVPSAWPRPVSLAVTPIGIEPSSSRPSPLVETAESSSSMAYEGTMRL